MNAHAGRITILVHIDSAAYWYEVDCPRCELISVWPCHARVATACLSGGAAWRWADRPGELDDPARQLGPWATDEILDLVALIRS